MRTFDGAADIGAVVMLISGAGGENTIIEIVERICGAADGRVAVGFGDDAALIRMREDLLTIVTTDALVEGTHFRLDLTDAYSLGWKSAAVNLSDVAAMGGSPTWCFVSIAVPDIEIDFIEELYRGISDAVERFGGHVIGGDTNRSKDRIFINVVQIGEVESAYALLRKGARAGDRVLVTGWLGESFFGFRMLAEYGRQAAEERYPVLAARHLRPEPRMLEARAAAETGAVHAMMDISDGLALDLVKMCRAGGCGARIEAARLPVSDSLKEAAEAEGEDAVIAAAAGGEDYELLMAVDAADVERVAREISRAAGTQVSDIGEFTSDEGVFLVKEDGSTAELKPGWQHF